MERRRRANDHSPPDRPLGSPDENYTWGITSLPTRLGADGRYHRGGAGIRASSWSTSATTAGSAARPGDPPRILPCAMVPSAAHAPVRSSNAATCRCLRLIPDRDAAELVWALSTCFPPDRECHPLRLASTASVALSRVTRSLGGVLAAGQSFATPFPTRLCDHSRPSARPLVLASLGGSEPQFSR